MPEDERCRTRNSGRRLQQLSILVGENVDKFLHLRPHAHQLHFALQDIHELRQFIQFISPQKTADSRDPRVPGAVSKLPSAQPENMS